MQTDQSAEWAWIEGLAIGAAVTAVGMQYLHTRDASADDPAIILDDGTVIPLD